MLVVFGVNKGVVKEAVLGGLRIDYDFLFSRKLLKLIGPIRSIDINFVPNPKLRNLMVPQHRSFEILLQSMKTKWPLYIDPLKLCSKVWKLKDPEALTDLNVILKY